MRKLDYSLISDPIIRDYFRYIVEDLESQSVLKGNWKFFEMSFDSAVTNKKIPHHLGFVPKDVLQLSVTGAGNITWNYSSFDSDNLDVTTTGACVIRAYIGSHRN